MAPRATEIWKPIPGFEGFYEFSSQGRVRALRRVVTDKRGFSKTLRPRTLRPSRVGRTRALAYRLSKEGQGKTVYLSTLWRLFGPEAGGAPWE